MGHQSMSYLQLSGQCALGIGSRMLRNRNIQKVSNLIGRLWVPRQLRSSVLHSNQDITPSAPWTCSTNGRPSGRCVLGMFADALHLGRLAARGSPVLGCTV